MSDTLVTTTLERVDFIKRRIAERREAAESFKKQAAEADEVMVSQMYLQQAHEAEVYAEAVERTLKTLFP